MPIRPGGLEHCREALQPRIAEEDAELFAEQPIADICVTVTVRAESFSRVVHVERAQALETDRRVDLVQQRVQRFGVRHVDAGDVEMARVEAQAEPWMAV